MLQAFVLSIFTRIKNEKDVYKFIQIDKLIDYRGIDWHLDGAIIIGS